MPAMLAVPPELSNACSLVSLMRVRVVVVRLLSSSERSISEAFSVTSLANETAAELLSDVVVELEALTSRPACTGPRPPEMLTPAETDDALLAAASVARSRLLCSVVSSSVPVWLTAVLDSVTVSLVDVSITLTRERTSLASTFSICAMSPRS